MAERLGLNIVGWKDGGASMKITFKSSWVLYHWLYMEGKSISCGDGGGHWAGGGLQ